MDDPNHVGGAVGDSLAQARARRDAAMRRLRQGFGGVLALIVVLGGGVWLGLYLARSDLPGTPGTQPGQPAPQASRAPVAPDSWKRGTTGRIYALAACA